MAKMICLERLAKPQGREGEKERETKESSSLGSVFLTKPRPAGKAHHEGRGMANMDSEAPSRLFVRVPSLAWDVLSLKCRQKETKGSRHPRPPSPRWQMSASVSWTPARLRECCGLRTAATLKTPNNCTQKTFALPTPQARSFHSKWIWTVQSRKKGLFKTVINHVPSEVSDMQTRNAKSEPSSSRAVNSYWCSPFPPTWEKARQEAPTLLFGQAGAQMPVRGRQFAPAALAAP